MRNFICTFSFPNSHIVFSSKIYVVLICLGVCFFAKRVHVLVKDVRDYHSLLYVSKTSMSFVRTIKVFCLAETIKVICSFTFQRPSKSFVLQRLSMSSVFNFQRLSQSVILQRQSRSSASLLFQDYQSLLSRLSQSSLLFQDYQSLLSSRL